MSLYFFFYGKYATLSITESSTCINRKFNEVNLKLHSVELPGLHTEESNFVWYMYVT